MSIKVQDITEPVILHFYNNKIYITCDHYIPYDECIYCGLAIDGDE